MRTLLCVILVLPFAALPSLRAELPSDMARMAAQYDEGMKTYDGNIAAMVRMDRDRYLGYLDYARRSSVSGKREAQVAAIDAEIKAVKAGPLPEKPRADLPEIVLVHRKQYLGADERAEKAVASSRRFSQEAYLKWLDGMAYNASLGKSEELAAAVEKEKKRVLADMAKSKKAEEPDKKPVKAGDKEKTKAEAK